MEKELQTILNYLDKIAEKLNIGIEQIWPWFIQQQYVDAAVSCVALIFICCMFGISMRLTLKYWRKDWPKYDEEGKKIEGYDGYSIYRSDHEGLFYILNGVLAVLLVIAGGYFVNEFFDIFNVKYCAFKDILAIMKYYR